MKMEQNFQSSTEQVSVFISYAREDGQFTSRLDESLRLQGIGVNGDWKLVRGAKYEEQLRQMILESDIFIFVISPNSVDSRPCFTEAELASEMLKKIIPVVYQDCAEASLHSAIREPQWTFLRDSDDFVSGVQGLVEAINTDFDLLPEHRRILTSAETWVRMGRQKSYLLRKQSLKKAEDWFMKANLTPNKLPIPTRLQTEYLFESKRARKKGTRITFLIVTCIAILMSFLSVFGLTQARMAQENAAKAKANEAEAIENAEEAKKQQKKAEEALESEKIAKKDAQDALEREKTAKKETQNALGRETVAKNLAEQKRLEAEKQTLIAKEERIKAEQQTVIAEQQTTIAEQQRNEAIKLLNTLERTDQVGIPYFKAIMRGHEGEVRNAFFTQSGNEVISVGSDGTVRVWDTGTGKSIVAPLKGQNDERIVEASISPDARFIFTTTISKDYLRWRVIIWELSSEKVEEKDSISIDSIDKYGSSTFAKVSPNAEFIFASDGKLSKVWRWDSIKRKLSDKPLITLDTGDLDSAIFSPNSRFILGVIDEDPGAIVKARIVRIWDTVTGRVIDEFNHEDDIFRITFSPDSNDVIFASGTTVHVREVGTARIIARLEHDSRITGSGAPISSPNMKFIVTMTNQTAHIWDITTSKPTEIAKLPHPKFINEAVFSPNSKFVVTSSQDEVGRVWQSEDGKLVAELQGHSEPILKASFSLDNNSVLTASTDETIRIWDPRTNASIVKRGEKTLRNGDSLVLDQFLGNLAVVDLQFEQENISINNESKFAKLGAARFENITATDILKQLETNDNPMASNSERTKISNGNVFVMITGKNGYAKVQVLELGETLKLRWTTYHINNSLELNEK